MTLSDFDHLRKQVAELIIVRASGYAFDSQRKYPDRELTNNQLQDLLKLGVGGVIIFGGTITELKLRCESFKKWANKEILLCADIEEGIGQRFSGGTCLVPPMAIAQIYSKNKQIGVEFAEEYGRIVGDQASRSGLNWVLAPVCDVNTNPDNPVINLRAWGEDPRTVSVLASAFQRGISLSNVLTCAKHFPGHGDANVDSHLDLPVLDHDLQRLESLELLPFRSVLEEGANSVMTAHLLLRSIDSICPATLSKKILTDLLRKRMDFDGLIVTDALIMESISKTFGAEEATVMAFEAGADLIMMPEDPYKAINAIAKSIYQKRISVQKLYKSLDRRRKELSKLISPIQLELNNNQSIYEYDNKEVSDFADTLIKKSIVYNGQKISNIPSDAINLLVVDRIVPDIELNTSLPAYLIPQGAGFKSIICNSSGISPWQKDNNSKPFDLERFDGDSFFLQLFIRGNPFVGSHNNQDLWLNAINKLQEINKLLGIVVYGCPYFWSHAIEKLDSSIPACYSPGQMQGAQEEVLKTLINPLLSECSYIGERSLPFTD